MKVATVVVTFNRKKLLLECLNALKNQTYPIEAIYIIDGPSTDGTPEALKEEGYIKELPPLNYNNFSWETVNYIKTKSNVKIKINYVRLYEDVGGAGGFYEGIKRAYYDGYDWIWLMDDDAEPKEDALEKLIDKIYLIRKYYPNIKLGYLCSKVLWKDGNIHKMNVPCVTSFINSNTSFNMLDHCDVIIVRSCSFVSTLINREIVSSVGLPLKDFFIWGDDVEYTLRITKAGYVGVYVKDSVVIHKTRENYGGGVSNPKDNPKKIFYKVRNDLYMIKKYHGEKLGAIEKIAWSVAFIILNLIRCCKLLSQKKYKYAASIMKGILAGIVFNPKIEKPKYN